MPLCDALHNATGAEHGGFIDGMGGVEVWLHALPRQARGEAEWWKLREAALLAVGSVSERLLEAPGGADCDFDLASFLANVLAEDLPQQHNGSSAGAAAAPPLLAGRALWVAARCGTGLLCHWHANAGAAGQS